MHGMNIDMWQSVNLDHPATFDTLAMDLNIKKRIMEDLERFVKRKEFYKRVGKAWKRGYLLFGPPGTGKSSLIAAMANYLKFNIYDLQLTDLRGDSELRKLLIATENKSILVVEDIDCSIELQDRLAEARTALLRPGRMDVHVHMSYCTPFAFKILASNYLSITQHPLFTEIEELIAETKVTPADIAEQLMKDDDAENVLRGLIEFLENKRIERDESKASEVVESSMANENNLL